MPDQQTRALRRLLRLHLVQAQVLQLIDGRTRVELDAFSSMAHSWGRTALAPGYRFARAIESAKRFFFDNWRYRSIRPADRVWLCRVVRLGDLKYALRGTNRKGGSVVSTLIRDFDGLSSRLKMDVADPGAVAEFVDVERLLLDLRAELLGARLVPYGVFASAVHGPGSCWVSLHAPVTGRAVSNAQYWRDRLGLHHFPIGTQLEDRLVRVTFCVQLSTQPCPVSFDEFDKVRTTLPGDIWLVRPSIGDVPNPRFVQANSRDTLASPAPTGNTIDLSTDAYHEAEEELVLLHGRDARLEWSDLELLDGLPDRNLRDDDHEKFVTLIEKRHARLSK